MRKKILVLAYVISQYKGSEFSVAWNYIKIMSCSNDITVLYGCSGEHLGDFSEDISLPNVTFVPVQSDTITTVLNYPNKRGVFVFSHFLAYRRWHYLAYIKAKELVEKDSFDLIHYLGPIGYREFGYLWSIDLPYMWGPIAGVNSVDKCLILSLPFLDQVKQIIRLLTNKIQFSHSYGLKKALKRVDLLLTATSETQKAFKLTHDINSVYLPENAIESMTPLNISKFKDAAKVELIFVGSLDSRKSLITLLKALCMVKHRGKVLLNVVGSGPLLSSLKQFCSDNGLQNYVKWHGQIKRKEVFKLMGLSHLHIITSISEANTTVIWEAMSQGVPTLSLDHCGMHDTICNKCGFLIPIKSYLQVIKDITAVIDSCIDNPDMLRRKADGVLECAKSYMWRDRILFFDKCYDEAISNFNRSK